MTVSQHALMWFLVLALVGLAVAVPCRAESENILVLPESNHAITFLRDGVPYLDLALGGWGPNWSWLGLPGRLREMDDRTEMACTASISSTKAELTLHAVVSPTGAKRVRMEMDLKTSKDTDLTMIINGLSVGRRFSKGKVLVTLADGSSRTIMLPLDKQGLGQSVKRFVLIDNAGEETAVTFDAPVHVASDGDLRIVLAEKTLSADERVRVAMTIDLPVELTYYPGVQKVPADPGFDRWYTFQPTGDHARQSEISMADWLESPAGKHGRILRRGDALIYHGKPIKLWGLNVCYGSCAPEKELAERRAAFYSKMGINSVRLHKYADGPGWAGIQADDSFVEFDEQGLRQMDYFVAQLKQHGVYVKLSSTFHVALGAKQRKDVPYMDEFGPLRGAGGRVRTGGGSIYFLKELQDLQIEQLVGMLRHENPYTGLTYAEDPAVAVVELFNEDSILFYTTMGQLQTIPTVRKRASERFCQWLKERYGSKQALLSAWGENALGCFANEGFPQESWEDETIVPAGNPWFFDPDRLAGSQASKKQRLLDTMLFLYGLQNEFYDRYVQAIRDAGYTGEILASNWQAGRAISHYYNLHSDWRVGLIDRHNYFGGGGGAKFNSATMLRAAGSGTLSVGMQQVADRPFMLSEWIHVLPNEWGVEGPALIGAYGMGLNGWDVSYMFQNRDSGGFSDSIGGTWNVTTPNVVGVFPAVARQVLRGDVAESDLVATRYVHLPSLHEGKLGFTDTVTQQGDVKTFDGAEVPAKTMAVARCVVEFTDEFRQTPAFELAKYSKQGELVSSTNQLRWHEGKSRLDGYFTIDTPATKAVVGFAKDQVCKLGEVTIAPQSRYGAIYVTARGREEDIDSAKALLVVAVARARNTGQKVLEDTLLLLPGKSPVVMEPVAAQIHVPRADKAIVHVLDHDGCKTGRTLPVRDGVVEIDGARDKTCYYLVSYAG
ncbi:MAG: hypothetical protein JXB62_17550 [Pirellulales bacterium]|nr:hypothetical protein [Pirellulales bacterium]